MVVYALLGHDYGNNVWLAGVYSSFAKAEAARIQLDELEDRHTVHAVELDE